LRRTLEGTGGGAENAVGSVQAGERRLEGVAAGREDREGREGGQAPRFQFRLSLSVSSSSVHFSPSSSTDPNYLSLEHSAHQKPTNTPSSLPGRSHSPAPSRNLLDATASPFFLSLSLPAMSLNAAPSKMDGRRSVSPERDHELSDLDSSSPIAADVKQPNGAGQKKVSLADEILPAGVTAGSEYPPGRASRRASREQSFEVPPLKKRLVRPTPSSRTADAR
jgi:hypothetical protein